MTRGGLQQLIRETRLALETPIDFTDLERRSVLERAQNGWFVLLQPEGAARLRLEAGDKRPPPRRLGGTPLCAARRQ